MDQVSIWKGEFGDAYTDRNKVDWQTKLPIFRQILAGLDITSILEIGCNRGHNLIALRNLLGNKLEIAGVEPNKYAASQARQAGFSVQDSIISSIPFAANRFDLVFTNGVLVHVPLNKLRRAIQEMYRVSRRYIVAMEFSAEKETEIFYRGYTDLFWKRDFLTHFETTVPVYLIRQGQYEEKNGDVDWWLFEKERNG